MQAEQANNIPCRDPESTALLHSLPSSTVRFALFCFFYMQQWSARDGRTLNSLLLAQVQKTKFPHLKTPCLSLSSILTFPFESFCNSTFGSLLMKINYYKISEARFLPSYTGRNLTKGQDILKFSAITKFGTTQEYYILLALSFQDGTFFFALLLFHLPCSCIHPVYDIPDNTKHYGKVTFQATSWIFLSSEVKVPQK